MHIHFTDKIKPIVYTFSEYQNYDINKIEINISFHIDPYDFALKKMKNFVWFYIANSNFCFLYT